MEVEQFLSRAEEEERLFEQRGGDAGEETQLNVLWAIQRNAQTNLCLLCHKVWVGFSEVQPAKADEGVYYLGCLHLSPGSEAAFHPAASSAVP